MFIKLLAVLVLVAVTGATSSAWAGNRLPVGPDGKLPPNWWEGEDFTWIRGANYISSFAVNSISQWRDYDPEAVERELFFANRLALNSVRVWMNYLEYEDNPKRFMKNFEDLLSRADKYGISVMPIIFDGCFGDHDPNFVTEGWVPNPGPKRMLPDYKERLKEYVDDLVLTHLGDPRIITWDIMNEPSSLGVPEMAKGDKEFAWDFAREWIDYVREIDRTHPSTIGVGNHTHIPWVWDHVDVVHFHCYQAFEKTYRMDIAKARELAKDKALVLTETSTDEMASTPELNFRILDEQKIGWYFFSLVRGRAPVTQAGGVIDTHGMTLHPGYAASILGMPVPYEAQPKRLDRFVIKRMFENLEKQPTTGDNFEFRSKAVRETVRCISWAGAADKDKLWAAVEPLKTAGALDEEGKTEESYRAMDKGLAMLADVVGDIDLFEGIWTPTISEPVPPAK